MKCMNLIAFAAQTLQFADKASKLISSLSLVSDDSIEQSEICRSVYSTYFALANAAIILAKYEP